VGRKRSRRRRRRNITLRVGAPRSKAKRKSEFAERNCLNGGRERTRSSIPRKLPSALRALASPAAPTVGIPLAGTLLHSYTRCLSLSLSLSLRYDLLVNIYPSDFEPTYSTRLFDKFFDTFPASRSNCQIQLLTQPTFVT
jgi:hypothetical protein